MFFPVEHLATSKAARQHTIKDVETEGKVLQPDSLPAEAHPAPPAGRFGMVGLDLTRHRCASGHPGALRKEAIT